MLPRDTPPRAVRAADRHQGNTLRVASSAAAGLLAVGLVLVPPAFGEDRADVYEDEVADEANSLSPADLSDDQLRRYIEAEAEIAAIRRPWHSAASEWITGYALTLSQPRSISWYAS